jgi:hypothetical protein
MYIQSVLYDFEMSVWVVTLMLLHVLFVLSWTFCVCFALVLGRGMCTSLLEEAFLLFHVQTCPGKLVKWSVSMSKGNSSRKPPWSGCTCRVQITLSCHNFICTILIYIERERDTPLWFWCVLQLYCIIPKCHSALLCSLCYACSVLPAKWSVSMSKGNSSRHTPWNGLHMPISEHFVCHNPDFEMTGLCSGDHGLLLRFLLLVLGRYL